MLQSETQNYYKILLPEGNAWEIQNHIGKKGIVEFENLQKKQIYSEKPYTKCYARCIILIEKINNIVNSLNDGDWQIKNVNNNYEFFEKLKRFQSKNEHEWINEFHSLESRGSGIAKTYFKFEPIKERNLLEKIEQQVDHYYKKLNQQTLAKNQCIETIVKYKQQKRILNSFFNILQQNNENLDFQKSEGDQEELLDNKIQEGDQEELLDNKIQEGDPIIITPIKYNYKKSSKVCKLSPEAICRKLNSSESKSDFLININWIGGIQPQKDALRFQRLVWRITRGLALIETEDVYISDLGDCEGSVSGISIKKDLTKNQKLKNYKSFCIATIGGHTISSKIEQLFKTFNTSYLKMSDSKDQITKEINFISQQIKSSKEILKNTQKEIERICNEITEVCGQLNVSKCEMWRLCTLRDMFIWKTLNMFKKYEFSDHLLYANYWCPESQKGHKIELENELENIIAGNFSAIQIDMINDNDFTPTYFMESDFFYGFQEIVNTYGVPRYKEINPAFFTAITFPFQFGVMYGDIGHGIVWLVFGIYLINWQNKYKFDLIKNENNIYNQSKTSESGNTIAKNSFEITKKNYNLETLFRLRYLFQLLGFYCVYSGLIYNDFISIMPNFFSTCYEYIENGKFVREDNCTYFLGFDWVWSDAKNQIEFFNSFKMKFAVIIGVLHMSMGICLKGANAIYFNEKSVFFFEFVPQLLFFLSIFGYMCQCIIIKWLTNWENTSKPPEIINQMINFITKVDEPIFGTAENQLFIQRRLFLLAIICIPVILQGKPMMIYLHRNCFKKKSFLDDDLESYRSKTVLTLEDKGSNMNESGDEEMLGLNFDNPEDSFNEFTANKYKSKKGTDIFSKIPSKNHEDLSEILIHQQIETIEFILGTVSNTASYLRLWAQSLAHGELAKVFYEMFLQSSIINPTNILYSTFGIISGYFVLAVITFLVLICMDFMECFQHTLRLHWVEFQNKFYKGDGKLFEPFSIQKSIDKETHAQET